MKLLKKIFCETEITWKLLFIYTIATGVIVGLLNCVPFLENTSFVAPAVTYEFWFVAAIFIISNCKKASEAVIKTFLFFLVSQPLIYLVEVPFKEIGWGLFGYYKFWFIVTLLTIPGAWIAYQIKRDNVLSAVILSVATGFLVATGVGAVKNQFTQFPYGLLTAVFCFFFGFILIPVILSKKKSRIVAVVCTVVIAIGITLVVGFKASDKTIGTSLDPDHQWEVVGFDSDATAEIEGNQLTVGSKKSGTYIVSVRNEEGDIVSFEVTFGDTITIRETE